MNKIYGIIVIFAFAGLMIPTSAMQVEAASDLDYMLIIAEKSVSASNFCDICFSF